MLYLACRWNWRHKRLRLHHKLILGIFSDKTLHEDIHELSLEHKHIRNNLGDNNLDCEDDGY